MNYLGGEIYRMHSLLWIGEKEENVMVNAYVLALKNMI